MDSAKCFSFGLTLPTESSFPANRWLEILSNFRGSGFRASEKLLIGCPLRFEVFSLRSHVKILSILQYRLIVYQFGL